MNAQAMVKALTGRRGLLIAAVIAAAVALAVFTRYGSGGYSGDIPRTGPGRTPVVTASSPTVKTTGHAAPSTIPADDGDDGVAETPAVSAVITDGPADPGEAAMRFLTTWLNTYGKTPTQWRDSLHSLVTAQLWDLLADADPATVPQGKLVGLPLVKPGGDLLAVVSVAINRGAHADIPNGTVTVTMTARSHRWLATQLDWTVTR
jgi:hypothetical protein